MDPERMLIYTLEVTTVMLPTGCTFQAFSNLIWLVFLYSTGARPWIVT